MYRRMQLPSRSQILVCFGFVGWFDRITCRQEDLLRNLPISTSSIRHGRIVDGSGKPSYSGDLGIRGKRIAAIGDLSHAVARRTIDAGDEIVAPGFIETMGWNSYILIEDPVSVESKLRQGCTTMLVGEGISEAPQSDATAKLIEAKDF